MRLTIALSLLLVISLLFPGYATVARGWFQEDLTPPTVDFILCAENCLTNRTRLTFYVAFTEPVADMLPSDFQIVTTGMTGDATISDIGVTGFDSKIYFVDVITFSGEGTVQLVIPETTSITDQAGNPLTGLPYISGEAYTVDRTPPEVISITRINPSPTHASRVRFRVELSEWVYMFSSTYFDYTTTGTLTVLAVTPIIYEAANILVVEVTTGTGAGTLRLDIPAKPTYPALADTAGNPMIDLPYTSGEMYTIIPIVQHMPLLLLP